MGNRKIKILVWVCLTCAVCGIYFKNIHGETVDETETTVAMLYEVVQSEPGGENNYFMEVPQVKVIHKDATYVTVAELTYEDGSKMNAVLKVENEEREITEWREGKNVLTVWMENLEGEVLEGTKSEYIYLVDTKPVQLELSAENGFSGWHSREQKITVQTQEKGSGIEYVRCIVNGRVVKEEKSDSVSFVVSENASGGNGVTIEVEAKDTAGHISRVKEVIYIDKNAPTLAVEGIKDGVIQNKDTVLKFGAADDNILSKKSLKAELECTNGEQKVVSSEWKDELIFKEEGSYSVWVSATDAAGNRSEKELKFTIDKTKPEIMHIMDWDGTYLQKFIPDFDIRDMVKDSSAYKYELFMDGNPYDLKTPVKTEGEHFLYVKVTDAAGNFSEAEAVFTIDRTKPEIIIWGVEDSKTCMDLAEWGVYLKNRGDRIVGIWINGEKAAWKDKFQMKEPGTYRILVRAVDAAGNRSVREIQFSVKELPEIEQKWAIPVKKNMDFKTKGGKVEQNSDWGMAAVVAAGCVIFAAVWFGHKKSSHKREDAG